MSHIPSVLLTRELHLVAELIGTRRAMSARRGNVVDAKIGPQDGVRADQDGVLGELAFACWRNCWPDLSASPRSGTPDVILAGNAGKLWRIDVKTTRRLNGRLLATLKRNPDVDVYVLAILTDTHVLFPGWAFASELYADANRMDLCHGPGYALSQDKLHRWD